MTVADLFNVSGISRVLIVDTDEIGTDTVGQLDCCQTGVGSSHPILINKRTLVPLSVEVRVAEPVVIVEVEDIALL